MVPWPWHFRIQGSGSAIERKRSRGKWDIGERSDSGLARRYIRQITAGDHTAMAMGRADVLAIMPDLASGDGKAIAGEFERDAGCLEFEAIVSQRHTNIAKGEDILVPGG